MLMNAYLLDFLVLNKLLYGTTIFERILNGVFLRRHYQTNYLFIAFTITLKINSCSNLSSNILRALPLVVRTC